MHNLGLWAGLLRPLHILLRGFGDTPDQPADMSLVSAETQLTSPGVDNREHAVSAQHC